MRSVGDMICRSSGRTGAGDFVSLRYVGVGLFIRLSDHSFVDISVGRAIIKFSVDFVLPIFKKQS
jgi:hypothetical protein